MNLLVLRIFSFLYGCVLLRIYIIGLLCLIPIFVTAGTLQTMTDSLLSVSELRTGRVGISIQNVVTGQYLVATDTQKKFIPASNLKILTAYLALKHLPDTLRSFYYKVVEDTLKIFPNGDPTFLHPDFDNINIVKRLEKKAGSVHYIQIYTGGWRDYVFGKGWMWDDYRYNFMPENSLMPAYENMLNFRLSVRNKKSKKIYNNRNIQYSPNLYGFTKFMVDKKILYGKQGFFTVSRDRIKNNFFLTEDKHRFMNAHIPVVTHNTEFIERVLNKLLHKKILINTGIPDIKKEVSWRAFRSQSLRATLKYMMLNSNNFIAEQLLLMMSNECLGYMNREEIIRTLYREEFQNIRDSVVWVDGSGLSPYNLFSVQDMQSILRKIYNEYGWATIQNIFSTGDMGTLKTFFVGYKDGFYAKTGSMNGVCCISGYFIGKKSGNPHAFSIFTNNVLLSVVKVKKLLENYLSFIIEHY